MTLKNNISKIFLTIYFIIGVVEIISVTNELSFVHHLSKPLIMPLLAIFYLVKIKQKELVVSWIVLVSLLFSWLGDVFLMYQLSNPICFMLGLGAFLFAHILYIACYIRMSNKTKVEKDKLPRLARYDFFLILIWLTLVTVLLPVLKDMKIPVIIYSIAITGMTLTALHRYQKTSSKSFWMVMIGALVFMLSDSIIAINKFLDPIPHANVWIMITYVLAQYLIIDGVVSHQTSNNSFLQDL